MHSIMVLRPREIRSSKPYGGWKGQHRLSEKHIPASEFFGAYLLSRTINDNNAGSSSIYLLDKLYEIVEKEKEKEEDKHIRFYPALPYMKEYNTRILRIALEILRENKYYPLVRFVKEKINRSNGGYNYLSVLVRPVNLSKITGVSDKNLRDVEKHWIPLWLLLAPNMLIELSRHGEFVDEVKKSSKLLSFSVKSNTGISIDRIRHSTRYGMIYSYNTTIPLGKIEYVAGFDNLSEGELKDLKTIIEDTGIGYKKSIGYNTLYSGSSIYNGGSETISKIIEDYVYRYCGIACCEGSENECYVTLYSLDYNIIIPLILSKSGNRLARYVNLGLRYSRPYIYLQITNKFYEPVLDGKGIRVVDPHTYVTFTCKEYYELVEALLAEEKSILLHSVVDEEKLYFIDVENPSKKIKKEVSDYYDKLYDLLAFKTRSAFFFAVPICHTRSHGARK